MQLSKIQLNWQSWRIEASRSMTSGMGHLEYLGASGMPCRAAGLQYLLHW